MAWFVVESSSPDTNRRPFWFFEADEIRTNLWTHPKLSQKRMTIDTDGANDYVNKCQKPWRLYRNFIIEKFCPVVGHVLDICSGTGSAAVACIMSNRDCTSVDMTSFQVTNYRSRLTQLVDELSADDAVDEHGRFKSDGKEFSFKGT